MRDLKLWLEKMILRSMEEKIGVAERQPERQNEKPEHQRQRSRALKEKTRNNEKQQFSVPEANVRSTKKQTSKSPRNK